MRKFTTLTAGTVVGLLGVLGLHATGSPLTLGTVSTTLPTTTSTTSPVTRSGGGTPTTTTTTTPTTGVRSATGSAVNYYFGVLSVKVTVDGSRITNVTLASISDGGNYRSQSIDQYATPLLEQEAVAAQSASIQSVSGASYTSAGFEQSLQSALTQLGLP